MPDDNNSSPDSPDSPDDGASFGLIRPFDIDDGQLDGLSPQECFVLGYELADIDHLLKQPGAIRRPVHSANRDRIKEACDKATRPYRITWMEGDVSEEWMLLEVI